MNSGSLYDQLEAGALRDELAPELRERERRAEAERAAVEAALAAREWHARLQFTGDGAEYFRIWIVNLLLTVATLGIYSAWAKVRKARYFWQNTRLDGYVFDYHGAPAAILRGRVIAVLLLLAYTWGFKFSQSAALAVIGVLLLVGPWLFMRAQQFKFRNTSHRGLRFGFSANRWLAYRTLLPPLAIWFSGTVAGLFVGNNAWGIGLVALSTLVLFPWMHHRLKRYQHGNVSYASLSATFAPATTRFYETYAKGLVLVVGAGIMAGALAAGLAALALFFGSRTGQADLAAYTGLIAGAASFGIAYLCVWPFFAARLQKAVWENTRFGPVRFVVDMSAARLFRLVLKCVLLTLGTLGLYWPFAAVQLVRFRVEAVQVRSETPVHELAAAIDAVQPGAAGEGAVDLFVLDIGL